MEFTPLSLLYDFCIMSLLLFIGKVMRSKIRFFQNIYTISVDRRYPGRYRGTLWLEDHSI